VLTRPGIAVAADMRALAEQDRTTISKLNPPDGIDDMYERPIQAAIDKLRSDMPTSQQRLIGAVR